MKYYKENSVVFYDGQFCKSHRVEYRLLQSNACTMEMVFLRVYEPIHTSRRNTEFLKHFEHYKRLEITVPRLWIYLFNYTEVATD